VREAAAKAGISESDVKVSVHRGLRKLSRVVKDGEG
jgi:DNA-directed RNA polymerase specialized sigma24 family protein